MPNQKISELTAIVTVDTSLDVLPIVDTSANTTKKISPTALKTALALDNVNNTSDANKPVSTAQQDALNAKVTANAAIVAATKTKITYDAKGLITAGDILDASDMPTGINAANIGTGVVSSTEFGYLDGVTSAIQTQLNAKQATLVSATNIKTINSTSLLGSGDISISASPPSGVAGAIQFSNGSAFASDASNLFWDDTNNRLGIGTNAPLYGTQLQSDTSGPNTLIWSRASGSLNTSGIIFSVADNTVSGNQYHKGGIFFKGDGVGAGRGSLILVSNTANDASVASSSNVGIALLSSGNNSIGTLLDLGARLGIKGSGSTSATTSLLVQNSSGANIFSIRDDGQFGCLPATNAVVFNIAGNPGDSSAAIFQNGASNFNGFRVQKNAQTVIDEAGTNAFVTSSAILELKATTKAFLPPRLTTTQRDNIPSPVAGLVLYNSVTNKLQCYNGSTWNDLF